MNSLLGTLILSVLANLLVKPAWVFTENSIQDELGHEWMGLYAAVFSFSSIFLVLSDLGISQWNVKEFSGRKEELERSLGRIWGAKGLLSLFFVGVCLAGSFFMGYSLHHLDLLLAIVFYQMVISAIQLQRAHLQSLHFFRLDSLFGNLDKAILLIFCWLMLYFERLTYENFLWGLCLSALAPFLLGWLILSRYVELQRIVLDWDFLRRISRQFMPFALMTILFSTNEKMNQVLIEKMVGEKESGLFAGAYRWNNAIAMYLWTILPVFFAKFSHHFKEASSVQSYFHLGWVIVAVPIVFVAFWVQWYGEVLFVQFTRSSPEELEKMLLLLRILIVTVALNACFNIFSTWLTACGYVSQTNRVLVVAISVNFLLSMVLVPVYQSVGGALALLGAFIVQSLGFLFYFLRYKNFELVPSVFVRSLGVLGVGVILLYVLGGLGVYWWVSTGLSVLGIAAGLWGLGLIKWKES